MSVYREMHEKMILHKSIKKFFLLNIDFNFETY